MLPIEGAKSNLQLQSGKTSFRHPVHILGLIRHCQKYTSFSLKGLKKGSLGKVSKRQNESWQLAINKDDHKFNFLVITIAKVCVALQLMRCSLSVIGESDPGPALPSPVGTYH